MKQLLIALTVLSLSLLYVADAQTSSVVTASHQRPALSRATIPAQFQEMKKNTETHPRSVPIKASNENRPYYRRPAGAFFSPFVAVNGCGFYTFGDYSYLLVKPYSAYTYRAERLNNYYYYWLNDDMDFSIDQNCEHPVAYDVLEQEPPKLCFSLLRDDIGEYYFQYPAHYASLNPDGGLISGDINPSIADDGSHLMVVPTVNSAQITDENTEFLLSSKTMVSSSVFDQTSNSVLTRFDGAESYGTNKYGWWFGKNGEHIDGIAQAFEKPSYPYVLNKVYLQAYLDMRVKGDVTMTCRVYRLDKIPAFVAGGSATLPEVPGELVATGEALVTPRTAEDKKGLIEFTLFSHDEETLDLPYEYTPTIDYPILICIDGYNEPEMENLEEFSAFVATNWNDDEGYGELAYVKCPIYEVQLDENGDTIKDSRERPVTAFNGHYYWCGLNNFFDEPNEMKTGLTIFISTERPYLLFNNPTETGEYIFGPQGGTLQPEIGVNAVDGIEFKSWTPSGDEGWTLLWNGSEELPDWLDIELIDGEELGHFNNIVTAHVTAEPMPKGSDYREAVIRFGFPGAYLDYKFIQRNDDSPWLPCGNEDITIATINQVIDLIINGMYDTCYDINRDDEINIADINALIDIILRY